MNLTEFKELVEETIQENTGLDFTTSEDRKIVRDKLARQLNIAIDIPRIGEAIEEVVFRVFVGLLFMVARKYVFKNVSKLVEG
jgi:hypothetical protein